MLIQMRSLVGEALVDFAKDWLYGKTNLLGVEIGSYAGESTEIFLKSNAFKTFYCIDPWEMHYDPNDVAGESDGIYLAEKCFDKKFENNPIVKKLKMKSFDAIKSFELESIDFLYIDGNHRYEAVKSDLINYYPRVKKGGIISGHDYEFEGTPDVKKAVDEFFKKPPIKKYADHSWLYIKE